MSKSEEERKVIKVADEPLFEELNFVDLVKQRAKYAVREKFYETRKKALSTEILDIVLAVNPEADSVVYEDAKGKKWTTNVTRKDAPDVVDNDKLIESMMKIGKLDMGTIKKIFAAATIKGKKPEPFITVVPPRSKKKNTEETEG